MSEAQSDKLDVPEHSIQALTFKPISLTKYKYYKNDEFQQGTMIKKENTYPFVLKYIASNKRALVRDYIDRSQTFFIDVVNQEIILLGYEQSIDEGLMKSQLILSAVDIARNEQQVSTPVTDKILHQDIAEKMLDKFAPRVDIIERLKKKDR